MNWRNVWLIFRREVLDQLRDRRTLFMVAVLPLLLYPALGIGMMQLTVLFSEQPRTVVILGAADLPPPQLLDGHRFAQAWFETNTESRNKLEVITDLPPENADTENSKASSADAEQPTNTTKKSAASPADLARRQRILNQAKELQVLIEQLKLLNPAAVERGRPATLLSPNWKPLRFNFAKR